MTEPKSSTEEFEAASRRAPAERYVLRLYIAGSTPASGRLVETVHALCDQHLKERYELSVVDVFQQPELARQEQIIAVPTLIKKCPDPMRKIVGDLADEERVLAGLGLKPKHHVAAKKRHT